MKPLKATKQDRNDTTIYLCTIPTSCAIFQTCYMLWCLLYFIPVNIEPHRQNGYRTVPFRVNIHAQSFIDCIVWCYFVSLQWLCTIEYWVGMWGWVCLSMVGNVHWRVLKIVMCFVMIKLQSWTCWVHIASCVWILTYHSFKPALTLYTLQYFPWKLTRLLSMFCVILPDIGSYSLHSILRDNIILTERCTVAKH